MSRSFLSRHLMPVAAIVLALPAMALAAPVSFDLPAQSLATSLKEVASQGGLNLVVTQSLLTGKTAPALKGAYEPTDALRRLLAGSGLVVSVEDGNAVVSQQTSGIRLGPVQVEAAAEGSAAAGYLVKKTSASGPIWGDLPLQDSPYSESVVSSQLIDNLQAYQPEDIVKVIPQITNVLPQQDKSGNPFFTIRGFTVTQFTNGAGITYDGLIGGAGGEMTTVLEDKERVEVLSGVDGFLYGIGSVGGNINYVLKRPTATPYHSITIGDNAGGNFYIHGDFGGPIGNGIVSYRLNLVDQDGDTSIKKQSIKRDLVSLAIDVHPFDNLLIQFNGAHSDYHVYGTTPTIGRSTTSANPAPADPSTLFTPPWSQYIDETDTAGARLTWKLNPIFTVRSAYEYTHEERPSVPSLFYTVQNTEGLVTSGISSGGASFWNTHSLYSFIDAQIPTAFGISNKITVGFNGSYTRDYVGYGTYTYKGITPTSSLYDLVEASLTSVTVMPSPSYLSSTDYNRNFVLGDEIHIGSHVILLAGGDLASITSQGFKSSGAKSSSGYSSQKITPSVSLIYKPLPWLSVYTTYQQSLQGGSVVQNSSTMTFTNNGEVLPPYVGDQYEVGLKATVSKNLLLTASLFDIDKAYEYTTFNDGNGLYTEKQDGREIHKGIELTATGRLLDNLTVIGGLDLIDPKIGSAKTDPALDGSQPADVSDVSAKIYTEYDLPYIPGLTLIGGFQYNSSYYLSSPDMYPLPGYVVGDLGLRYAFHLYRKQMTFRFNVDNVSNAAYWQYTAYEGTPRTFLATVQMQF